ncbi:Ig-like domain-containing protein [Streptomyces lavendulocolor]|uniref:L,D-transpeptidase n=1 Tax=Streptomyces lavendulocolor TaxID=67316 RepID=UPI0033EFFDEE
MFTAQAADAATTKGRSPGPGGRARRSRTGLLALALGAVLLGATACGASAGAQSGGSAPQTPRPVASILPKDGATGVGTSGALRVSAAKGKLTKVTVASSDRAPVDGAISADGRSWTPAGVLHTGTRYTVSATAADAAGHTSVRRSSFTTLTPTATNIGNFNVAPAATYGVGMEVSVNFTKPVADRAAVDRAVTVTADPQVDVRGHWFGKQRLDFRPENYWAPGTKVTLHLRLNGVQTSAGVYGQQSKDVSFTIGRSQTSVADNKAHTLTVHRDGKVYKTLPASLGDTKNTTYNGKMVIMEKTRVASFDSRTVGLGNAYNIPDVPHAMRMTTSGTFTHGNYWQPPSVFGRENTSHGCVGLRDAKGANDPSTPAAWFFDNSLIGDVIEVVNSPDKTVAPDNGWSGWNMPWSQWTAG